MKMQQLMLITILLVSLQFQACICLQCHRHLEPSGIIEFKGRRERQYEPFSRSSNVECSDNCEECWEIQVPPKSFIFLEFKEMYIPSKICTESHIKVTEFGVVPAKETVLCSKIQEALVAYHDVRIEVFNKRPNFLYFNLKYYIKSFTCNKSDDFLCSNSVCVPSYKVCDGIKDCINGMDENSCRIGILSVDGVDASLDTAYTWLENNATLDFGWKNNFHRAIVALQLSGKMNFGSDEAITKYKLLLKQLELETAIALLRNSTEPVSVNKLSMLLNALLVTCHNPRLFYGYNLVQLLLDSIKNSEDSIQPIAYLALCNAKEPVSKDEISHLVMLLKDDPQYPFIVEIQAVAFMALSCILKSGHRDSFNVTNIEIYNHSVEEMKKLQNEDGSFGNVYTSALVFQALLSKGEENNKGWHPKRAISYLMNELKSQDFLSTYMILPILNRKSLASIADVDCKQHLQQRNGNPIEKMAYKFGPKIRIQYSLYLGQNKDVVHTIYLTVTKNSSAFEVMEVAGVADPKYKFQSKSMSGKMYVFEINGYITDPEAGLFWLTYLTGPRFNDTLTHFKTSLDKIEVQEEDHLVMWYKPAHL